MAPSLDNICTPRVRRYSFWSLIALLTALTVHDVYVLVDEYLENPKEVDMMVIFNETITFPNITICGDMVQFKAPLMPNATLQKTWDADLAKALKKHKTKKDFLTKDWGIHMASEAMSVVNMLSTVELEVDRRILPNKLYALANFPRFHVRFQMIEYWMKVINDLDVTYPEFFQKTGEEILKKSLHQMRRYSQADEHATYSIRPKITWISDSNFCFQPTFTVDEPIKRQGQFLMAQFKMDLDALEGQDVVCMRADFHGRPSDFIRNTGSAAEKRSGLADEICPGQYMEVRAEVKNIFDMLPNDTPGRECEELFAEGKNSYDCRLYCRIDYIRALCKCTPASLIYLVEDELELNTYPMCNYTQCNSANSTVDPDTEKKCISNCKRDCHQVRYTITPSDAKKTLALTNKHKEIIKPELITMSFIWGSFEYVGLQEGCKYSPVAFISALGGAIGVYLGLSVLTLVVGLVYGLDMSYQYLNDYWSDRKQTAASRNGNDVTEAPAASDDKQEPASNGTAEK